MSLKKSEKPKKRKRATTENEEKEEEEEAELAPDIQQMLAKMCKKAVTVAAKPIVNDDETENIASSGLKLKKKKKAGAKDEVEGGLTKKKGLKRKASDELVSKDKKKKKIKKITRKTFGKYAFEANYLDHFETSIEAFKDLEPILMRLADLCGKTKQDLCIYDPFYCEGAAKKRLNELGFTNVINENRDFYADVAEDLIPNYDILITNPPYSADNKEKILNFCAESGKPWALLIPSYVMTKEYYYNAVGLRFAPFFCCPDARYNLTHPKGTGHTVPLFDTFWAIDLGRMLTTSVYWWMQQNLPRTFTKKLVRTQNELPACAQAVPVLRPNPRKRRKLKELRAAEGIVRS